MYEQMYGLDADIMSFAVANDFVQTMNKGCYQLGVNLKPFCFFPTEIQDKYGVIDLTAFSGLVNSNETLVNEISAYRRQQYSSLLTSGIIPYTDKTTKTLFLDYLLSVSICYLEVPKYYQQNGVQQVKYDKYFATRNPRLMSAWTGNPVNEMQAKYSGRLSMTQLDFSNGDLKVVKLAYTAKGNTISCPRNAIGVDGLICVPLFMQYAFLAGLMPNLNDKILKFTYLKDNNVLRELNSTLSETILMSYYNDESYVEMAVGNSSKFSVDKGGVMLTEKQSRGYIRIPELGASRYDYSGVRAVNIARLLSIQELQSVDRTFIDVDLNSVRYNFDQYVDFIARKMPEQLPVIMQMMGLDKENGKDVSEAQKAMQAVVPALLAENIKQAVETRSILLSTSFLRTLHLFMINNPQWFPAYTGKKVENSSEVGNSTSPRTPSMNIDTNSVGVGIGTSGGVAPTRMTQVDAPLGVSTPENNTPSVADLLNIGDVGVN